MKLFDSHAHYFDKRFSPSEDFSEVDQLLETEVFGKDVGGVINVGTGNRNNIICIEQAARFDKMYAAVGIHPDDVEKESDISEEIEKLSSLIDTEEKRRASKIVAIGEIGLDYHYEGFDKELQQKYFDRQMELATELDMPVIIHDRDAHGDCFETVLRYPNVRGVFHSYSGSVEMAKELVRRGWYISFSGVLTFKNARKAVEVAESVPMERILIETDCPYLAPHPHRGKMNHSGLMRYTAEKLAEIKGVSLEEIADQTFNNAKKLFSI